MKEPDSEGHGIGWADVSWPIELMWTTFWMNEKEAFCQFVISTRRSILCSDSMTKYAWETTESLRHIQQNKSSIIWDKLLIFEGRGNVMNKITFPNIIVNVI